MGIIAVIGAFSGHEGKGNVCASLAKNAYAVARYNGGFNESHRIYQGQTAIDFHLLPAGMVSSRRGIIGNDVVIDPEILLEDLHSLSVNFPGYHKHLCISKNALVSMPPTKSLYSGEAPAFCSRKNRVARILAQRALGKVLRVHNIIDDNIDTSPYGLSEHTIDIFRDILCKQCFDTDAMVRQAINQGELIIAEGVSGTYLDLNSPAYPFVAPYSCTSSAITSGLGVSLADITATILVVPSFFTCSSSDSVLNQMSLNTAALLRSSDQGCSKQIDHPFIPCWLDLTHIKEAALKNGADGMVLTKIDMLCGLDEVWLYEGSEALVSLPAWQSPFGFVSSYYDLPFEAKRFVDAVEAFSGIPILAVTIGPRISDFIWRDEVHSDRLRESLFL